MFFQFEIYTRRDCIQLIPRTGCYEHIQPELAEGRLVEKSQDYRKLWYPGPALFFDRVQKLLE